MCVANRLCLHTALSPRFNITRATIFAIDQLSTLRHFGQRRREAHVSRSFRQSTIACLAQSNNGAAETCAHVTYHTPILSAELPLLQEASCLLIFTAKTTLACYASSDRMQGRNATRVNAIEMVLTRKKNIQQTGT